MDLFIPSGGRTRNWYIRVFVPVDLKSSYGKTAEFRQSTKTADKIEAMARASTFISTKAEEFKQKRAEIAAVHGERIASRLTLDKNAIRNITSVRFTDLLDFDLEIRDARGPEDDPAAMEAVPKQHLPQLISIIARRKGAPGYQAYVDSVLKIAKAQGHSIARDDPLLDELVLAMATREKRAFEVMQKRNAGEYVRTIEGEGGPWLHEILAGWESQSTEHMEPKTKSSYRSRIQSFIKYVHDKPGHQVERKDVYEWLLQRLYPTGERDYTYAAVESFGGTSYAQNAAMVIDRFVLFVRPSAIWILVDTEHIPRCNNPKRWALALRSRGLVLQGDGVASADDRARIRPRDNARCRYVVFLADVGCGTTLVTTPFLNASGTNLADIANDQEQMGQASLICIVCSIFKLGRVVVSYIRHGTGGGNYTRDA